MVSASLVTDLQFHVGGWRDLSAGLLGYLSFRVAGVLVVDGATLRSTVGGRVTISWPERRDGSGRRHPIVRPADVAVRHSIEQEILEQLRHVVPGVVP